MKRAGFTLIELLVVIAVLGVVTSIGVRAFIAVSDGWRTQEIRLRLNATSVKALDEFQSKLALTVSSQLGGVAISGVSRLEEKKRYGRVSLEDDRISIPVQLTTAPGSPAERHLITYSIDRDTSTPRLIRTEARLDSTADDTVVFEVAKGIMSMRFEYFDGTAWKRTWDQKKNPQSVRVSLVVQDEDRPYEQMPRTAVFPIRVD